MLNSLTCNTNIKYDNGNPKCIGRNILHPYNKKRKDNNGKLSFICRNILQPSNKKRKDDNGKNSSSIGMFYSTCGCDVSCLLCMEPKIII